MFENEIYIRIAEDSESFIYTVRRSGRTVETAEVRMEETVAPGYYGGSEVMD